MLHPAFPPYHKIATSLLQVSKTRTRVSLHRNAKMCSSNLGRCSSGLSVFIDYLFKQVVAPFLPSKSRSRSGLSPKGNGSHPLPPFTKFPRRLSPSGETWGDSPESRWSGDSEVATRATRLGGSISSLATHLEAVTISTHISDSTQRHGFSGKKGL